MSADLTLFSAVSTLLQAQPDIRWRGIMRRGDGSITVGIERPQDAGAMVDRLWEDVGRLRLPIGTIRCHLGDGSILLIFEGTS